MNDTIGYIRCPICKKSFILEDKELVCMECAPQLEVDIATSNLSDAINILKTADTNYLQKVKKILIVQNKELTELLLKITKGET